MPRQIITRFLHQLEVLAEELLAAADRWEDAHERIQADSALSAALAGLRNRPSSRLPETATCTADGAGATGRPQQRGALLGRAGERRARLEALREVGGPGGCHPRLGNWS